MSALYSNWLIVIVLFTRLTRHFLFYFAFGGIINQIAYMFRNSCADSVYGLVEIVDEH